jgi:hypothetical protein
VTRFTDTAAIESGWRTLTPTEKHWAEQLLDAAGSWIRSQVPGIEQYDDNATFVSIDVVRGALAPGTQLGMAAFSKTIGPWAKSGTLVNPSGHLTFTEFHKELLGIVGNIDPEYNFQENDY